MKTATVSMFIVVTIQTMIMTVIKIAIVVIILSRLVLFVSLPLGMRMLISRNRSGNSRTSNTSRNCNGKMVAARKTNDVGVLRITKLITQIVLLVQEE